MAAVTHQRAITRCLPDMYKHLQARLMVHTGAHIYESGLRLYGRSPPLLWYWGCYGVEAGI